MTINAIGNIVPDGPYEKPIPLFLFPALVDRFDPPGLFSMFRCDELFWVIATTKVYKYTQIKSEIIKILPSWVFCYVFPKYRSGWLPYNGYRGDTVAAAYRVSVTVQMPWLPITVHTQTAVADYRGSVTVQMPWFLIFVPRKPWWPIIAEACPSECRGFWFSYQANRRGLLPRKRFVQLPWSRVPEIDAEDKPVTF